MKKIKDLETRWQNHLMILAAFRYCLGRQSYIVSECVRWLSEWWEEIPQATKDRIIVETEEALENDTAGDICDRECWIALLVSVKKEATSN